MLKASYYIVNGGAILESVPIYKPNLIIGQIEAIDRKPEYVYLQRLIVREEFRWLGFGRKLLLYICHLADLEAIQLELDATGMYYKDGKDWLLDFYKSVGFVVKRQQQPEWEKRLARQPHIPR